MTETTRPADARSKTRMPPGIFDDPTFGLTRRFAAERIPVADGNRWWAEVLGCSRREGRKRASDTFPRTTDGHRWIYLRSAMEAELKEMHGRRLFAWLTASIEGREVWLSGIDSAGGFYPYGEDDRWGVLQPYQAVAVACAIRALDLGCEHADEMLALSRRYFGLDTNKHCFEWGWTRWLPAGDEEGRVRVVDAIRWWSITADLGHLEAQADLTTALEIDDSGGGPFVEHAALIRHTCPKRLSVLHNRVQDAMDFMINGECSTTDLYTAPDLLHRSLVEAHALDPDTGRHLIGWTRGYFPHIAAEVEEVIR